MLTENCCAYYREKAGFSQQDIADIMGLTQQAISRLEHDPWGRSLRQLLAYARAVKLPLVTLLPVTARMLDEEVLAPCRHCAKDNGHDTQDTRHA